MGVVKLSSEIEHGDCRIDTKGVVSLEEINAVHKNYWKKGYGSISAKEAYFIQEGIIKHKPKSFVEIGTASGLSGGFVGKFLQNVGAGRFLTLDFDTTFWVDRTKPTGFLIEKIFKKEGLDIEYVRDQNSTYLKRFYNRKFDMAFVDANHHHPWPALDMIALLPAMEAGGLVYHHDLALYKLQTPIYGIGPKYLYDQMPEDHRMVTKELEENIFYIITPVDYKVLEKNIIELLYLPWTIRTKIDEEVMRKFVGIARDKWGGRLAAAVEFTAKKFNKV